VDELNELIKQDVPVETFTDDCARPCFAFRRGDKDYTYVTLMEDGTYAVTH
jgi:hypothetical protein